MHLVEIALECLSIFKPELLLVSAGFDAYVDDPITQMTLEAGRFRKRLDRGWPDIKIPTACVLEGGYSDELPQLIDVFLSELGGRIRSCHPEAPKDARDLPSEVCVTQFMDTMPNGCVRLPALRSTIRVTSPPLRDPRRLRWLGMTVVCAAGWSTTR